MSADVTEQVRAVASSVFYALPKEEPSSEPPEAIAEWDSMQRLNLVLALEENFGIEFAPEEIETMETLVDFATAVEKKQRG